MSGGTIGKNNSPDVLILGGGLAGLSAAVDLTSNGRTVLLVEKKPHLGGRTYSFRHPETGDDVDNGQHLMMGCYHSTLRYLKTIGSYGEIEIQKNLSIQFRRHGNISSVLKSVPLPAPLHILFGLFRFSALRFAHRLALLRVGFELLIRDPETDQHLQSITVEQWLDELKQPDENKEYIWNILAIGALNDSPSVISAAMFVKVLASAFFGSRQNSSMIIPKKGLSAVLVDSAVLFIQKNGGIILPDTSVNNIEIDDGTIRSVTLKTDEKIFPKTMISALPYYDIPKVFSEPEKIGIYSVDSFVSSPIVTLHLWYSSHFVPEKFAALIGSPLHWVFNKSLIYGKDVAQPMYLSIVVSGARDLIGRDKEELVRLAHDELKKFYPAATDSTIVHSLVIKEKRATFSPNVEIGSKRPSAMTSVRNLFLAGDWTDTKLPATIEGAVQSGYASSLAAMNEMK